MYVENDTTTQTLTNSIIYRKPRSPIRSKECSVEMNAGMAEIEEAENQSVLEGSISMGKMDQMDMEMIESVENKFYEPSSLVEPAEKEAQLENEMKQQEPAEE